MGIHLFLGLTQNCIVSKMRTVELEARLALGVPLFEGEGMEGTLRLSRHFLDPQLTAQRTSSMNKHTLLLSRPWAAPSR